MGNSYFLYSQSMVHLSTIDVPSVANAMRKRLYVKEGVGFEGITMMHPSTSKLPHIFRFFAVLLIIIGLLGFVVAGVMQIKKQPTPNTAVVVLPTSAKEGEEIPTDVPVITQRVTDAVTTTQEPTPSVTSSKKNTPTPSPTTTANKPTGSVAKSFSLEILNGSGTKGAAKVLGSDLETAGYTITRTGNADAFTYQGVTIQIKKSKATLLEQLKKDLSTNNYLVSKSTTDLEETADSDALVIVGSNE